MLTCTYIIELLEGPISSSPNLIFSTEAKSAERRANAANPNGNPAAPNGLPSSSTNETPKPRGNPFTKGGRILQGASSTGNVTASRSTGYTNGVNGTSNTKSDGEPITQVSKNKKPDVEVHLHNEPDVEVHLHNEPINLIDLY
jgi:hypothetical protein